jgi:hypothetical protein
MYVAGTPTFDADHGGDWACDYVWWPDDRVGVGGVGGWSSSPRRCVHWASGAASWLMQGRASWLWSVEAISASAVLSRLRPLAHCVH